MGMSDTKVSRPEKTATHYHVATASTVACCPLLYLLLFVSRDGLENVPVRALKPEAVTLKLFLFFPVFIPMMCARARNQPRWNERERVALPKKPHEQGISRRDPREE